ncbi:hypothetical protein MKW98_004263 [Papaver atlanticum]|uniref:Uncharacterized protein n=1 Tax=Papaver atlanticum TaxID=357466 RepID=A0AAD4T936_9MAGN|nr:hypothetical protein MKW98_004263 [Papaver atlanticum]
MLHKKKKLDQGLDNLSYRQNYLATQGFKQFTPCARMLADNGICCLHKFDKGVSFLHSSCSLYILLLIEISRTSYNCSRAAGYPTGRRYDKSKPLKTTKINKTWIHMPNGVPLCVRLSEGSLRKMGIAAGMRKINSDKLLWRRGTDF